MKSLIIIGGGFSGSTIARKLQNKFKTTLVDEKDYFEFTPGVPRTILEPNHVKKIQKKYSTYLKKTEIINKCVKNIDDKFIYFDNSKLEYDYLVICSGSRYNTPFKEQNVILADRTKHFEDVHNKVEKSKDIVIIGGGLVGIEITGEILGRYKDKNITIIHSHDKLINRQNKKSIEYVTKYLKKRSVKIIYKELAKIKSKNMIITDKGTTLKYDLVFLATGIEPNSSFIDKKYLDENRFIKVNRYLQFDGLNKIFACGDVNDIHEEKTAQNAELQGKIVANNILALENNSKLKEYHPKKRLMIINLGRYNGVLTYGNFCLSGIIPGILKGLVEIKEMLKFR